MENKMENKIDNNRFCIICEEEIQLRFAYHFSGIMNGKNSNHIHVCSKCVSTHRLPLVNFDEIKHLGKT